LAVFDHPAESTKPQQVLPTSGAVSTRKALPTGTRLTVLPSSVGTVPSQCRANGNSQSQLIGTSFY